MSPRVAIEEAIDGEFKFFVEASEHTAYASGWLPASFGEDAVVFFPEFIFVEAAPDGIFLDVEDEFGGALFELDDIGFDD